MTIYRVFELLKYFVEFYMLVVSLRVILSWFAGGINNQGIEVLRRFTDPYLNVFRRVRILRVGLLDLSPLLGIYLLVFLSSLLTRFSQGNISLAVTLYTLFETALGGISSLASLFTVITVIRIIGLFVHASSIEHLWYRIDAFLQPMINKLTTTIIPKRNIPYGTALGLFLGVTFIVSIGLKFLVVPIAKLISFIPF